jgi:hypothetical protein
MLVTIEKRAASFWQNDKAQYWLLGGITLLATAMRFFRLGAWSFWIDEIFTINRAGMVINHVTSWPPILPPLSVILTHYVLGSLGTTEWTARLVSNLIGIATIPLLYFPIRRLFSPAVGLITALLLAVSPWHLYWSQNARFYTSLQLLYSLAFFAFFIGYEEGKKQYFLLTILFLILAMGERLSALFILPTIALYLLLLHIGPYAGSKRNNTRILAIVALPLIFLLIYDAYRYFTTGYSIILVSFEIFSYPIDDPVRLMTFITFNLSVPIIVLAAFGAIYLLLQKDRAGLYVSLGAFVPFGLSLILSLFVFVKDRYVFTTLINWLILAATAVTVLWKMLPRSGKILALGVICILVAESLWVDMQYFTINNGHRRDWRGAFQLVENQSEPNDIVSSSREQLGDYYLDSDVFWMGDFTPDEVLSSGQTYWFVADSESVWVTGPIWDWVRANGELIDKKTLRIPEDMTLWIYRYEPSQNFTP